MSKETGLMVLPMVVIYQLLCKQGNITNLYKEKDKARTVLKYVLMVTAKYLFNLLSVYSRLRLCCFSEHH